MDEGFKMWALCVFLACILVVSEKPKSIRNWSFRLCWQSLSWIWHWSATWRWDVICAVGWLGMAGLGEFVGSVICLALAALGTISKLVHWHAKTKDDKTVRAAAMFVGVPLALVLMIVITLAYKSDKPWSQIPEFLASFKPLTTMELPVFPEPTVAGNLVRTDPSILAALEREIQAGKKQGVVPVVPIVTNPPPLPPALEVNIGVGDDNADHVRFRTAKGATWIDQERHCEKPLTCYPERDLNASTPIPLNVGAKSWARIFFSAYNVGGSTIPHPSVDVIVGQGHDVSVNRMGQRQSASTENISVEFPPTQNVDVLPFDTAQTGYAYAVDVSVGPLIDTFVLVFRMYSENLPAHRVEVKFQIVRN